MSITTSIDNPPPSMPSLLYFERCLDPWHVDAFPVHHKKFAPNKGEREQGWAALDFCRNMTFWIPDGTNYDRKQDLNLKMLDGPCGRLCAVPDYSIDEFEREMRRI